MNYVLIVHGILWLVKGSFHSGGNSIGMNEPRVALQFARDGVLLCLSIILVFVSLSAVFSDYILSFFTTDQTTSNAGLDLLPRPDWYCAGRGSELREWNLEGTGQSSVAFDLCSCGVLSANLDYSALQNFSGSSINLDCASLHCLS